MANAAVTNMLLGVSFTSGQFTFSSTAAGDRDPRAYERISVRATVIYSAAGKPLSETSAIASPNRSRPSLKIS